VISVSASCLFFIGEFVKQSGRTQVEIAKTIGVSPAMITEVLMGRKRFGADNAAKIVEVSKGSVTLEELLWPEKFQKAINE
jgi:DNA-binding transcriptional regulator YdaS (Cro superfamily)